MDKPSTLSFVAAGLRDVEGSRYGATSSSYLHQTYDDVDEDEVAAFPPPTAGAEEANPELAAQIALWEQMAAGDYAEVGFDNDVADVNPADMAALAEREEPGSASAPGHNLFEADVRLEGPAPQAPPAHRPPSPITSNRPPAYTEFTDADYIALKAAASKDYPQPADSDVSQQAPQQQQQPPPPSVHQHRFVSKC